MTRLGYFLFCLLLTAVIYGVVYFSSPKHETLVYTVTYFSIPLIATNFLMAIYSLFHWFMRQNEDVAKEGMAFLNATWIIGLATFLAYKIINAGGLIKFFSSFR